MEALTIVFSGKPGAGSTTSAKLLSERLDYNFFSAGQLFKEVASGKFKDQYYSKKFNEICSVYGLKVPDLNSENDSEGTNDLWNTPFGKSPKLHNVIDALNSSLGNEKRVVIEGKLAINLIQNTDYKVWSYAPFRVRAKREAEKDNLNLRKSWKVLWERQKRERKNWSNIYGFDYWDQKEKADLTIDTSKYSPEEIVNLVLKKINR